MQFVAKTQAIPYKTEDEYVPSKFTILPGKKVMVSETSCKNIYLDKSQFIAAIKAMEEKLGFLRYQISEERINVLKKDIALLITHMNEYKKVLATLDKNSSGGV